MYFGFEHIYVNYNKKKVLWDFSLEVGKGEILTIVGQNGCGKSSLLRIISKSVVPKSGRVIFRDKPIKKYSRKELAKNIAYLSQVQPAPADIDVKTLVSYGRYPHMKFGRGLSVKDKETVDEALKMTGLSDLKDQKIATLSGGERQRAFIAMAIAQEPEILILDEPTTYLDISYQIEILELIKKLNSKYGITIIMVLHDLNLAARYSDKLVAVKNHEVYSCGKPEEVLTEHNLREVFHIDALVESDSVHNCPYFIPLKTRLV